MSGRLKNIGKLGESIAVDYLIDKGFSILHKNYSRPRWGEIDIIALDNKELVFVEVKTRTTREYGDPLLAVNKRKMRSIRYSIDYFLKTDGRKYINFPMRIDVIGIKINAINGKVEKIDYVNLD